jgi:hypothetical protein
VSKQVEEDKKVKLLKEVADIKHEQEHIKGLLRDNKMQELNDYLQGELTQKHYVEKALHNMMNPNMPVTIYDNANNAFNFLEILKREKEAELAKKLSNVDN